MRQRPGRVHRAVWPCALAYTVAFLVAAAHAEATYYAMALANLSLGVCAAWIFAHQQQEAPGA